MVDVYLFAAVTLLFHHFQIFILNLSNLNLNSEFDFFC